MSHRRSRSDGHLGHPVDDVDTALDAFAAWAALHVEAGENASPVRPARQRQSVSSVPAAATSPGPGRRRSITAPRVRERDLAAFHQLARTGVAAERHLIEGAGLSAHRLDRLTAARFVERGDRIVDGRLIRVYTLGPVGVARLRRDDFGQRYKRNPHQLAHDLKLTEMYYALPSATRCTWRHEGELIAAMKSAGTYAGTCVDAAVFIDGQWVAIEALSAHYSRAQIAAKEAVISEHFGGWGVML